MAIFGAFLPILAFCDDTKIESKAFNFTLTYADKFQPIKPSHSLNPLTLKSLQGEFPTFNILVQPGSDTIDNKNLSLLSDRVLESYRNSGFLGAILTNSRIIEVSGRPALECLIEYKTDETVYHSLVTVVPSQDRSFILTYIDTKKHFDLDAQLAHAMIGSFAIGDSPPLSEQRTTAQNSRFWAILGILLAMLGYYWLKPRLTNSRKS